MKKKLLVLALVAMAGSASAATVSYSASVAPSTTNWNQTLNFGLFDTSLGVLNSVTFNYFADITSTFRAESLDATSAFVTATTSGNVTFGGPIAHLLGINSSVGHQLSAFDGVIDFGGTSGFTTTGVTGSSAGSLALVTGLNAFEALGGGIFGFDVAAVALSNVSGSGSLLTQINTVADANVTVIYDYSVPSHNPNHVPEPETLALIGLGLAGIAATRRKADK